MAEGADTPASDFRSMGLGGVLYDKQSVLAGKIVKRKHICRAAVKMNRHNCLCPRCQEPRHLFRIDVICLRIAVCKDDSGTGHGDRL